VHEGEALVNLIEFGRLPALLGNAVVADQVSSQARLP
jgi:hypothetical protein